jgi:sugar phosphate isomerase/epimerase
MKYGCCTTMEYYDILCSLGFDFIELPGRSLYSMSDDEFSSMYTKITSGQVYCGGINTYCPPQIVIAGPGFDLDSARNYARICAYRLNEIGGKNVGIGSPFSRTLPCEYDRLTALVQAKDFFKATAEEFGKYDINVCVEALGPCYCNFINKLSEAVDMVKEINYDNIKIVLDFYNMEHNKEADIDLSFAMNYINHVHISDDDGDPKKRYFLCEDKLPLHKQRLHNLKSLGYDKTISIEIDLPVKPVLAKNSLNFIKSIFDL